MFEFQRSSSQHSKLNVLISLCTFDLKCFCTPCLSGWPIGRWVVRLEEKAEHFESALAIVERGLQEIPRYGPLWFGAFRLSEKLGKPVSLPAPKNIVQCPGIWGYMSPSPPIMLYCCGSTVVMSKVPDTGRCIGNVHSDIFPNQPCLLLLAHKMTHSSPGRSHALACYHQQRNDVIGRTHAT